MNNELTKDIKNLQDAIWTRLDYAVQAECQHALNRIKAKLEEQETQLQEWKEQYHKERW